MKECKICEIFLYEYEVGAFLRPQVIHYVPRRKSRFCCVSLLPVFLVRVSMTFHIMSVHIIFNSVWVADWLPYGKELLTRLTIRSLCFF